MNIYLSIKCPFLNRCDHPTWVLDGVYGDSVVGFAGTQSPHHVLNPPQLALHLSFLLLRNNKLFDYLSNVKFNLFDNQVSC